MLNGANKIKNIKSKLKSSVDCGKGAGYGGHFRAVQGFKYIGDAGK
jgi:hypothetical protein